MATRSAIGIVTPEGKVRAVYCHWDGYPQHVGKVLDKHYTSIDKVYALMDQGNLSSLAAEIGDKHDFDTRVEGICTFYGRDRGEEGCESRVFATPKKFIKHYEESWCEYFYLFDNGVWTVYHNNKFISVDDAIKEIENEEA